MSKLRLLLVYLCAAPVLLCAACVSRSVVHEVSVKEAEDVLNQAVACVAARDLDGLCELSGSALMCESEWRSAGEWNTAPVDPPAVVDTYLLPTEHYGNGSMSTGGRVLVLEGSDALGKPYRSEFLVFDSGQEKGVVALDVVYWAGISIGKTDDQGTGRTPDLPANEV